MQYGQMATTGSAVGGIVGNQLTAGRDATQLEVHLKAIQGLHEDLSSAAQRAKVLADRLLGAEPENISKDAPKVPSPTALLMQLDLAQQTSREITQAIHYHLNRLERL